MNDFAQGLKMHFCYRDLLTMLKGHVCRSYLRHLKHTVQTMINGAQMEDIVATDKKNLYV